MAGFQESISSAEQAIIDSLEKVDVNLSRGNPFMPTKNKAK